MPQDFRFGGAVGSIAFSTKHTDGQTVRVPSVGIVIRAAARIEPHAASGTMHGARQKAFQRGIGAIRITAVGIALALWWG